MPQTMIISVTAGISGAMFQICRVRSRSPGISWICPPARCAVMLRDSRLLLERSAMNATARPSSPPFGRIAKLPSGLEMHYLEQGKGQAVVLVHGSGPGANGYSNFKRNIGPIAEARVTGCSFPT